MYDVLGSNRMPSLTLQRAASLTSRVSDASGNQNNDTHTKLLANALWVLSPHNIGSYIDVERNTGHSLVQFQVLCEYLFKVRQNSQRHDYKTQKRQKQGNATGILPKSFWAIVYSMLGVSLGLCGIKPHLLSEFDLISRLETFFTHGSCK